MMEEEREKGEKAFQQAMEKETEKCGQLLKEQHGRLSAALEEERVRSEEKTTQALQSAHQSNKVGGERGNRVCGRGGIGCVGERECRVWGERGGRCGEREGS